jgi:hypothetical protein
MVPKKIKWQSPSCHDFVELKNKKLKKDLSLGYITWLNVIDFCKR